MIGKIGAPDDERDLPDTPAMMKDECYGCRFGADTERTPAIEG
jgi:hypothetical protein